MYTAGMKEKALGKDRAAVGYFKSTRRPGSAPCEDSKTSWT